MQPRLDVVAFYGAEREGAVRLARSILGSTEDAEDVAQDAFARLLPRWDTLDDPVAYLRTCVVNACRSELRKRAVRRRAPAAPPQPHEDRHAHLFDALARVPARQRIALVLRYQEGLGEREVAAALGCREAAARSLLHRGLARLRAELGG